MIPTAPDGTADGLEVAARTWNGNAVEMVATNSAGIMLLVPETLLQPPSSKMELYAVADAVVFSSSLYTSEYVTR